MSQITSNSLSSLCWISSEYWNWKGEECLFIEQRWYPYKVRLELHRSWWTVHNVIC